MRHEKKTIRDVYRHSETGEIIILEKHADGTILGSCPAKKLLKDLDTYKCKSDRNIWLAEISDKLMLYEKKQTKSMKHKDRPEKISQDFFVLREILPQYSCLQSVLSLRMPHFALVHGSRQMDLDFEPNNVAEKSNGHLIRWSLVPPKVTIRITVLRGLSQANLPTIVMPTEIADRAPCLPSHWMTAFFTRPLEWRVEDGTLGGHSFLQGPSYCIRT